MSKWLDSYRVTIFVPLDALEDFILTVSPHIPAFLGTYDHVCWWSENGIEQSRKVKDGVIKRVPCARFECFLPYDEKKVTAFIETAVKPAHPWEEPVIVIQETKNLSPA